MVNTNALTSRRIEVSSSFDDIQDYYEELGWTDGLPVVPATNTPDIDIIALSKDTDQPLKRDSVSISLRCV